MAGQFVASPTYDVETSSDVWDAIGFAMAVGAATALVISLLRIREVGVESVRKWVLQADIDDGAAAGTTTAERRRIRELERECRELRRANAILRSASGFFAATLDRPHSALIGRTACGCVT